MKLLRFLLFAVLGLVALWLAMGLFAKNDYHVERSLTLAAPHDIVYEQVRYFKNFPKWSPWQSYDPNMVSSIEGTDGEPGAVYKWSGNDDVGSGTQTIKAVSPERIDLEVKFTEPWESVSPTFIKLEDRGDSTHVAWGFDMHVPFPWNAFAMLTDVDLAVGKDYLRGLENLKRLTEGIANKTYNGYKVKRIETPMRYYVGLRKTLPLKQVGGLYASVLPKVAGFLQKLGVEMAGPPSGLYFAWNDSTGITDLAAAIPVTKEVVVPGFKVFPVGGKAYSIDFYGAYDSVGQAHRAMDAYLMERKLASRAPVIEEYVTDPMKEPDTSKWLTRVIYLAEEK